MNFILNFFKSLPNEIKYAIERGLDDIHTSSKGDLDILIRKTDFPLIVKKAHTMGILISVSVTYGGARIFLGDHSNNIKRIDFDWTIHHRGLPLDSIDRYIEKRYEDPKTGLFVLPEEQHATIINLIKNKKGGAKRYAQLLEKYNYPVLNKKQHKSFVFSVLKHHPIESLAGTIRFFTCYLLRVIYPTGLKVSVPHHLQLENQSDIMYLFQNRISYGNGLSAFINSHFLSRLCVTYNTQRVDITLNSDASPQEMTANVVEYLRSTRTCIPFMLFKLA